MSYKKYKHDNTNFKSKSEEPKYVKGKKIC